MQPVVVDHPGEQGDARQGQQPQGMGGAFAGLELGWAQLDDQQGDGDAGTPSLKASRRLLVTVPPSPASPAARVRPG
jgi:hypothetical protein